MMRGTKHSLVFLLLFATQTIAQKYSFISYSTNAGLAQSQVVDIVQDSKRYLWVATQDGLSKFNGKSFVNYYEKDGLISNAINSLFVDERDKVWVVSTNGISILNEDSIFPFEHNRLFLDKKIGQVIAKGNKLWVSTEDDGIFYFQQKKDSFEYELIHVYKVDFFKKEIRSISCYGTKLYVSTSEGIYVIRNSKVEKFAFLENEGIRSVCENSRGELWVATSEKGIYFMNKSELKHIHQFNSDLVDDYITHLLVDDNDRIWVSTNTSFSEIDKGGVIKNYNKKNGFGYISQVVFEDKEGNIWIGTDGKGLVKFTNKEFLYLTEPDELHSGLIISVGEDANGDLWFGTFKKGVSRLTESSDVVSYKGKNTKLPSNYIWTSLRDKNDDFWLGTSEGLARYDNNTFVTFTSEDGLPSNKVQSLFQEVDSVMWVGTSEGVTCYKNQIFNDLDSFPYTNVRAITSTEDGCYWFGTSQGLVFYDGFESKLIEDSLLVHNKVYSLVSQDEKLWIGTLNGLIFYDGNKFKRFRFSNENNQSVINFLLMDKSNFLWIGTNNGVFTLDVNLFNQGKKVIRSYTTNNGLIGMETNLNSIFQDSKDNVWFGTSEGINKFRRDSKKETVEINPTVHLTNVKLFFEKKNWLGQLQKESNLSFGYKKNTFTFYYHANYFKDPSSVRYSYKLEGANEDWSPMGVINFSRYPNLPHGKYTFMVKSTIDGKTWSDIEQVSFVVSPPFWLNLWFIVLVLLLLSLLFFLIFNRRRNAIKKERELELLNYKNKLIKLEQQSLNSSMNRHFIFNSLNSIQFYINKEDKLSANRYLSNFSKLIRKNLDSSTSEDSLIPLSEEIERLSLYLSLENMRFKEKFTYEINLDGNVDAETTKVPGMFMQPFVENSIWHGILPKDEPGKIDINIHAENDKTYFEIIDNGIGISTSIRNKTHEENSHSSQGMKIATNRIELLQKVIDKEIKIEGPTEISKNGKVKGTRVVIIFS